jgi:CRP/FNR family transcriptional regulator, anaerobic regulatory protein
VREVPVARRNGAAGLFPDFGQVQFPFTQQHLADALCMSLVHTNKTLRRLTASKAVRWKNRTFEILDRDALTTLAGYQMSDRQPHPFI